MQMEYQRVQRVSHIPNNEAFPSFSDMINTPHIQFSFSNREKEQDKEFSHTKSINTYVGYIVPLFVLGTLLIKTTFFRIVHICLIKVAPLLFSFCVIVITLYFVEYKIR